MGSTRSNRGRGHRKGWSSGWAKAAYHFYESVVQYLGGMLMVIELEDDGDPEILEAAVSFVDWLAQAFVGLQASVYKFNLQKVRIQLAYIVFANAVAPFASNEALINKVSLTKVETFQVEFRKLSQLSGSDKFEKDKVLRPPGLLALGTRMLGRVKDMEGLWRHVI
ncbi:hypothetical protein BGZ79_000169 [Entomortierella chlamydospora]|nr:hypothetical protein BGZ79_000169 [Entomortierella chlamydospora]